MICKSVLLCVTLTLWLTVGNYAVAANTDDPGSPDTVYFSCGSACSPNGDTLYIPNNGPNDVTIFINIWNDNSIQAVAIPLVDTCYDSPANSYLDSAKNNSYESYKGSRVENFSYFSVNLNFSHRVLYGAISYDTSISLEPGDGLFAKMIYTVDGEGIICLDTLFFPPTNTLIFVTPTLMGYSPVFLGKTFIIAEGTLMTGAIAGEVKDASTQQNLQDVLVEALQEEVIKGSDNTDADGNYTILGLQPGSYDVRASRWDYETQIQPGQVIQADKTTTVDFQLTHLPTGDISGFVFDALTSDGLGGVLVWFLQDGILRYSTTTASGTGLYELFGVTEGNYDVLYSKVGYITQIIPRSISAGWNILPGVNLEQANVLFTDDFEDGARPEWNETGDCTWELVNGTFHTLASGSQVWCAQSVGSEEWWNYVFEVDIRGDAGVDKIILFREQGDGSHYDVNLRSDWLGQDELRLSKYTPSGGLILLGSVIYSSENGSWYHLTITCISEHISIAVYNEEVLTYEDVVDPITSGGIALVCYTGSDGECDILFDNVSVACPSFDLTVDIREDLMQEWNDTTEWFVLPFSLQNSGLATLHDLDVTVDIGGSIFNHTIPSLPQGTETLSDTIDIPSIWKDQNITVSIASVAGCPTDFLDSKKVSVYYCTGGSLTDPHAYDIFQDSYHFLNPALDWETVGEVFQDPTLILTSLMNLLYVYSGSCFGMAASSNQYFIDSTSRPVNKITYEMDLTNWWVLESLVYYHLSQYFLGHFYESFGYVDPNKSEGIANDLIQSNQPVIVSLRETDGGHAVAGYKILQDITTQKTLLYLYDNERPGQIDYGAFDLEDHTFDYRGWHSVRIFRHFECLSNSEIIGRLPDVITGSAKTLWDKGKTLFSELTKKLPLRVDETSSTPSVVAGRMLVTDQYGRKVGFIDGVIFVNEIPGAEVMFAGLASGDTVAYYEVPYDLDYTVEFFACNTGEMTAEVLKPTSDQTALTLAFIDIPVTQGLTATLFVDSTYDYTLNIDEDGDGTTDTSVSPTVDNLPPVSFDLLFPPNQESVFLYPPLLDWSPSSDLNGDTVFYRVYVDEDSGFSSSDSSEWLTDTSWTSTVPLHDSTLYFWKVKAFDNRGGFNFSKQTWSFFVVLPFIRGDANGDEQITIADAVYLINYLFKSGPEPVPIIQVGDVNCDSKVDIIDVVYLVNYLFKSGPPPCH